MKDFLVLFSIFVRKKLTVNKNVSFTDYASRFWLEDPSKLAINPKTENNVRICSQYVIQHLFIEAELFFLSSLLTNPSFMSISSLVLYLWQFSFIRDLPEIQKLEICPSGFCTKSGDCRTLEISNLSRTFQMKFC